MFTIEKAELVPNSDVLRVFVSAEMTFGATTAKVDRWMTTSQRVVLGDNPAWTDEDLRVGMCTVLATDDVRLAPEPEAERAEREAREAAIAALTDVVGAGQ